MENERRILKLEEKKKYWMGKKPTHCQVCKLPLIGQFVDGRIKGKSWAIMGIQCFEKYGVGLGTGRGQLYCLNTLEKLEG